MYSIIWIDNGILESVSTPSLHRAITIADALFATGSTSARIWKGNKLI